MKAKNSKVLLSMCMLALQLSTFSTAAMAKAKGGMDGGGGDALVHATTGEVISIADPLASEIPVGRRILLPKAVREEVLKIRRHAEGYFFSSVIFEKLTSEDNILYLTSDELPDHEVCKEKIKYHSTSGSEFNITPAACTTGKRTWFKKSIYNQLLKMSTQRELALLIVHEGLRRVSNLADSDLTAITNGLRASLSLYDLQLKGDMTKISDEQRNLITTMMDSILMNNLGSANLVEAKNILETYVLSDYGGLVANDSIVEEDAVVGAGSIVKKNVNVGKKVIMLGTIYSGVSKIMLEIYNMSTRGEIHKVLTNGFENINGEIQAVKIPENVKLINSRIETSSESFKNSIIENSDISLTGSLGQNAQIKNTAINFCGDIGANVKIENSTFANKSYKSKVGANLLVTNSKVKFSGNLGKESTIKDSTVDITDAGENLKILSSSLIKKGSKSYGLELIIGDNFELSNSKLTFTQEDYGYTEKIPNNVSFKNTNATFNATGDINQLFMLGSLGKLTDGTIKFSKGLKVDFGGSRACKDGEEDVFQTGESRVKIKTQEDLVKYCK